MNKVEITKFSFAEVDAPKETFGFLRIPSVHTLIRAEGENLEVTDGYHTFDELYDHRITLFITLARILKEDCGGIYSEDFVWRSKLHDDGSSFDGWFILGLNKNHGRQMSYHIPLSRWDETNFAETLEKAPKFDGHTSADVLERLKTL